MTEDERQVIRSRVMRLIRQAVRIHEVAVAGTDLPGFGIHHVGKSVNRTARRLCECFGSIVAGFEQQAIQEILG